MDYQKPAWLQALFTEKYFALCSIHLNAKKNEKNVCCIDCCTSICPHCVHSHRFHRLLQVRRYVYHEVVRLEDLEELIDCSGIQAYTINSAKVVFIKKRPQNRQFKGSGNYCTSCDRSLQEPYIHCSLGCKVDFVLKHYKDLSSYLRKCHTLQLGPDFFVPQEIGDDYMANEIMTNVNMSNETMTNEKMANETMTNETLHSTIVDCDEPMSCSSDSSVTESLSKIVCTNFVRKKRSSLYLCGRSASYKVSDEQMASSMSRRKGIPHRSPLC